MTTPRKNICINLISVIQPWVRIKENIISWLRNNTCIIGNLLNRNIINRSYKIISSYINILPPRTASHNKSMSSCTLRKRLLTRTKTIYFKRTRCIRSNINWNKIILSHNCKGLCLRNVTSCANWKHNSVTRIWCGSSESPIICISSKWAI